MHVRTCIYARHCDPCARVCTLIPLILRRHACCSCLSETRHRRRRSSRNKKALRGCACMHRVGVCNTRYTRHTRARAILHNVCVQGVSLRLSPIISCGFFRTLPQIICSRIEIEISAVRAVGVFASDNGMSRRAYQYGWIRHAWPRRKAYIRIRSYVPAHSDLFQIFSDSVYSVSLQAIFVRLGIAVFLVDLVLSISTSSNLDPVAESRYRLPSAISPSQTAAAIRSEKDSNVATNNWNGKDTSVQVRGTTQPSRRIDRLWLNARVSVSYASIITRKDGFALFSGMYNLIARSRARGPVKSAIPFEETSIRRVNFRKSCLSTGRVRN